jgi:hypothetical protein
MTESGTHSTGDLRARLAEALGDAYVLGRELGRGGFAVVFAARDTQLDREIAVKVLRPELVDVHEVRVRFQAEAAAIARLRHPHIVPIYAVGEEGTLGYFTMPLVEGETLTARLARDRRLEVDVARRVLREAAGALAAAHRAGLVHRDIKPDNVMLEGDEARVLLMDFGIAKALSGGAKGLTMTGTIIGTPHYMSPEQASGDAAIDARSDLYSLGVVGYEMLTGKVPFDADSAAGVLVKHLTEEAPPVTHLRPDCPGDLAAIIARCLEKAPEQRCHSAVDLVAALDGRPVRPSRTSRASTGAILRDPVRRYRLLAGGVLGAVGAAAIVDLVFRQVLATPLVTIAGALVLALGYGALWQAGFSWREALGRGTGKVLGAVDSLDSAEFGPHLAGIQTARHDRVAMRAALSRLPRAQRTLLADVLPRVDHLVALATELARELYALERQAEPGLEELERRISMTRGEPPAPGRDQRLVVLERRREALLGVEDRRREVSRRLSAVLGGLSRIRIELEKARREGLSDVEREVHAELGRLLSEDPGTTH